MVKVIVVPLTAIVPNTNVGAEMLSTITAFVNEVSVIVTLLVVLSAAIMSAQLETVVRFATVISLFVTSEV